MRRAGLVAETRDLLYNGELLSNVVFEHQAASSSIPSTNFFPSIILDS